MKLMSISVGILVILAVFAKATANPQPEPGAGKSSQVLGRLIAKGGEKLGRGLWKIMSRVGKECWTALKKAYSYFAKPIKGIKRNPLDKELMEDAAMRLAEELLTADGEQQEEADEANAGKHYQAMEIDEADDGSELYLVDQFNQ